MKRYRDLMLAAYFGCVTAATLLAYSPARAQSDREPCPDAGDDASPAEQAVCWFDRHDAGESTCAGDGDDACLENAVAWCRGAPLDDPRVRDACFLAPIRAGHFDQAAEVAEYLSDPSPAVARCRDAVTGMQGARVVTNPPGAEVTVDGRAYGAAPIEVQLPSPWWERSIAVRFGGTEVAVAAEALARAFDPRACQLGDILVEGPASAATARGPSEGGGDGSLGVAGWVLVGVGAAAGVTSLITGLVAESTYQDLSTSCTAGPCGSEYRDDISRGSALALTSTVTTFIGAGVGAVGVILLIVDAAGGSDAPESQAARITPGPSPWGLGAEVRF